MAAAFPSSADPAQLTISTLTLPSCTCKEKSHTPFVLATPRLPPVPWAVCAKKQKSQQNFCGTTMAVGIVGKAHSLPNASLPAAVYCRKLPDNAWLHLSPDKTTLGFLSNTSQKS